MTTTHIYRAQKPDYIILSSNNPTRSPLPLIKSFGIQTTGSYCGTLDVNNHAWNYVVIAPTEKYPDGTVLLNFYAYNELHNYVCGNVDTSANDYRSIMINVSLLVRKHVQTYLNIKFAHTFANQLKTRHAALTELNIDEQVARDITMKYFESHTTPGSAKIPLRIQLSCAPTINVDSTTPEYLAAQTALTSVYDWLMTTKHTHDCLERYRSYLTTATDTFSVILSDATLKCL